MNVSYLAITYEAPFSLSFISIYEMNFIDAQCLSHENYYNHCQNFIWKSICIQLVLLVFFLRFGSTVFILLIFYYMNKFCDALMLCSLGQSSSKLSSNHNNKNNIKLVLYNISHNMVGLYYRKIWYGDALWWSCWWSTNSCCAAVFHSRHILLFRKKGNGIWSRDEKQGQSGPKKTSLLEQKMNSTCSGILVASAASVDLLLDIDTNICCFLLLLHVCFSNDWICPEESPAVCVSKQIKYQFQTENNGCSVQL